MAVAEKPEGVTEGVCAVCAGVLGQHPVVRLRNACLRACDSCGSWTYYPRGGAAEQVAIHDSAEYFDHPYFALRRTVTPAQRRRCRGVFSRLAETVDIEQLRGERLLDIGCDTGTFLEAAREEFGIVPVGLDVARRAVAVARERGIEAYAVAVEQAQDSLTDFSVATAIDLVEHVADPAAFLRAVRARLRPGGILYLETPNLRSAVFGFGRRLSLATGGRPTGLLDRLFPPQHIQMFTTRSLRGLAERAGLEVAGIGTRVLPARDIAASPAALAAIGALQVCDRLFATEILIWAVLRRPAGDR